MRRALPGSPLRPGSFSISMPAVLEPPLTCRAPRRQVHCRPPRRRRRLELLAIKVKVRVEAHALQQLAPPRLDGGLAVAAGGGQVEGDGLQLAAGCLVPAMSGWVRSGQAGHETPASMQHPTQHCASEHGAAASPEAQSQARAALTSRQLRCASSYHTPATKLDSTWNNGRPHLKTSVSRGWRNGGGQPPPGGSRFFTNCRITATTFLLSASTGAGSCGSSSAASTCLTTSRKGCGSDCGRKGAAGTCRCREPCADGGVPCQHI